MKLYLCFNAATRKMIAEKIFDGQVTRSSVQREADKLIFVDLSRSIRLVRRLHERSDLVIDFKLMIRILKHS